VDVISAGEYFCSLKVLPGALFGGFGLKPQELLIPGLIGKLDTRPALMTKMEALRSYGPKPESG
jgi:hypothetical protein